MDECELVINIEDFIKNDGSFKMMMIILKEEIIMED